MTILCHPCSVRWLYTVKFEKIDFPELADCGKSMLVSQRVQFSVEKSVVASLSPDKAILLIFQPLKIVLLLL
jgi:hypothetical protein